MKSLLVIPLSVSLFVGAAVLILSGHGIRPIDAATAGVIAAAAGMLGWMPMMAFKVKGVVEITQLALIGSVIHLASAIGLTVVALKANVVDVRGAFVYWLLGAYAVSLIALIWQLRQRLLSVVSVNEPESLPAAKVKG